MNNILCRFSGFCRWSVTTQTLLPGPNTGLPITSKRSWRHFPRPLRPKYPFWFLRKQRAIYYENLTKKNREFLHETVEDKYGPIVKKYGVEMYDNQSPLIQEPWKRGVWKWNSQRTGLIAKKIGVLPMWSKNGERIVTTLLQLTDNHVIKYIPPEEFTPLVPNYDCPGYKKNFGALLVGSDGTDPQRFTKEYCGLFTSCGIMPKNKLVRFLITPEAAVQPGTPLYINHFQIGQYVDIRGYTIGRGFQGVMKRWGFHGQPATHGQTKTHRRPGTIGRGRNRPILKGKKMPGHVGFRCRTQRGLKILRINTKFSVMWVQGRSIPGNTGDYVYVFDSIIRNKRWTTDNPPSAFPTFYPEEVTENIPEDIYAPEMFDFSSPSIMYEIPVEKGKKK